MQNDGVCLTLRIYQKSPTLWKTRNYLFILAVALVHKIQTMKQIKGLLLLVGGIILMASCSLLPFGKNRNAPAAVLACATASAAERDSVAPGIQPRGYRIEGHADAPFTRIGWHGVHQITGKQHAVTGLRRRAHPFVCVVGAGRGAGVVVAKGEVGAAG